eukprot:jgi/Picre1/34750/NNA_002216.t1
MAATGANAVKVATAGPKETRDGTVPTGQITRQVGEEDPELAEFLSLMQPRHKKAIWSNEDAFVQEQNGLTVKNKQSLDVVDDGSASDEEYEDVEKATEDGAMFLHHTMMWMVLLWMLVYLTWTI